MKSIFFSKEEYIKYYSSIMFDILMLSGGD